MRSLMPISLFLCALARADDPALHQVRFLWQDLSLLAAADGQYLSLQAQVGPGWVVGRDPSGAGTRWILPGELPPSVPTGLDAASVARARDLLERWAPALGVSDPADFVLARSTRTPAGGGSVVGIDFRQTLEGLPVRNADRDARVRFRFHAETGRLMALGTDAVPVGERPAPALAPLEGAVAVAGSRFPGARFHGAESFFLATGGRLRRMHEVRLAAHDGSGSWSVRVDAGTGELVEVRNRTLHADVIGTVTGGTSNHPGAAFSQRALRDLRVTILETGAFGHTDGAGSFTIPHLGGADVTVTGRLLGLWTDVRDGSGPNYDFSRVATPGVPLTIELNTVSDEFTDAEVAGYAFPSRLFHYVRAQLPAFDRVQQVRVNGVASCIGGQYDAFTNEIRMARAVAGSCNNGATEDLLGHEYGHSLHDWVSGGLSPEGLSEGIGDHLSMFFTGQRIVGRSYRIGASPDVRDYNAGEAYNRVRWPQVDPYFQGATWAGFCLDVKDNLVARLGAAAGRARAELVTIGQYARDPSDIPDAVLECFIQDDNNGNLLDGTPYCADLVAAADRHDLPRAGCGLPPARDRNDLVVSNGLGFLGDCLMRVKANPGPELGTFGKITDLPMGDTSAVMMEVDNWSYLVASGNTLYFVNMNGPMPVVVPIAAAAAPITGIDLDQDGSVVATTAGQQLVRFTRMGAVQVLAAGLGAPNGIPNCVAVDLTTGEYVVGIYDVPGSIVRVHPTTGAVSPPVGLPIAQVTGIDQDVATGDFYLTRFGALERMTRTGIRNVLTAAPEMATANGLEVFEVEGRTDRIVVVEAGGAPTGVYDVSKADGTIRNVSVCPRGSADGLGPTEVCLDMSRYLSSFGPAAPGGVHDLRIADNANPGQVYALRAALSYRPGIALTDGRTLWLAADPLFFATPLLPAIFQNFAGVLDGNGRATARVNIPATTPIGLRLYVSGVIVNPGAGVITRVLNTVGFSVR